MSAAGLRLRCCPFCGGFEHVQIRRGAGCYYVYCMECKTEGPMQSIFDYVTPSDYTQRWEEAEKLAEQKAVEAWNMRAGNGSYYIEEMEDLEQDAQILRY